MNAIPIEKMDKTKHEVGYVHVVYPNGYRVWYHAEYVPYRSVEADGFCNPDCDVDWFDYDKEKDKYWAPEGFYECPEGDETEHLILGDDTPITHWAKSLPDPRKESAVPALKKLCERARKLPEGSKVSLADIAFRLKENIEWRSEFSVLTLALTHPEADAVLAAVSAAKDALKELESES